MNLCDYDAIRALLGRHGFHFSKSMGQNFLIDPEIPQAIARACGAGPEWGVLEIGPGIGSLTAQLAPLAGRVAAVELDRDLLPMLAETLGEFQNVHVISGDVLKLDLPALLAEEFPGMPVMACANLPYNITSPVLEKLVETAAVRQFTVMVQREVAQRICAVPGSGGGSSFSLFLQYYMEPEYLFSVPPDRFYPAPKVTSAVIRCVRRDAPPVHPADEALFFRLLRGAFALRRKTLANSLSSALGLPKDTLLSAIRQAELPETVRGEQLTLEDLAKLCEILHK